MPENRATRRWVPSVRLAVTVGSLVAMALLVAVFGWAVRTTAKPSPPGPGQEPPVVATRPVVLEPGYAVERRFVGRIEARREADVGFELGGLVAQVGVDEGDPVAVGGVVARLDTRRLGARRAELVAAREQAAARRDLAALIRDRTETAFSGGAANQREFDEAEKELEAAAAAVTLADAAVASVDTDIAKATIRAPFAAVVSRRHVDPGRVVRPGTPVVTLLDVGSPRARIGVASSSVDGFRVGQVVAVAVGGREIGGRVEAVLPTRDALARDVDVLIALDGRLNGLRQGDLARLSVERAVDEPGFWVPTSALTEGVRGLWSVYVPRPVGEGGGVEADLVRAEVEVLHAEADRVFVRGALGEGDRFVSDGLHRVALGMRVRDAAAMDRESE
ncbi:MAG: efflux RND transporter periplasmic adaptor subunit [Planctomycetota bacterium]